MDRFRRTVLFIALPLVVVMAAAGLGYHVHNERDARRTAQQQLHSAAELTARLVERRIERIEGAVESILLHESLYHYAILERAGADDTDEYLYAVEQALLRLAEREPDVVYVELYHASGKRFLAVIEGERDFSPISALGAPWFSAALEKPRTASLEPDGRLRLTLTVDDRGEPLVVARVVYEFEEDLRESAVFATRHLKESEVALHNAAGELLFQHGARTGDPATMKATDALGMLGAAVTVRQAESAAMAAFYSAQRMLFAALGLVTLGLVLVAAFGTHLVVRDLRRAQQKADEANRAKSAFLATMSHEIRTPMNGVLGMAELLAHTPLEHEQREYLSMIQQSAESLLRILNDILDFSKIEAGRLELESIPFRLRECVGKASQTLAARAAAKDLELACRVAPDLPEGLIGDPGRLRQILVNLVGNAIKFTEQGEVVVEVERNGYMHMGSARVSDPAALSVGSARVSDPAALSSAGSETRAERKKKDEVQRDSPTCRLHFTVRDTGIGIPPEKQKAVFEAFIQADVSTTRRYGGTGLGLTISSELVRMMGGEIWLESEAGRGTVFHFTAEFGLADLPPAAERPQPPLLEGQRALVVDDNATNRRILQEVLKSWRMQPTAVENGPQALAELRRAAAEETPYRYVLLDLMMPDLDGFDVAQRIREMAELEQPVVLLLSSVTQPGDAQRRRELNVAVFLTKPVVQSELLDALLAATEGVGKVVETAPEGALQPAGPRLKILLAEDGLVNQRVATGLLTRHGHEVAVAPNGRAALEAWEREPFDLILMDLQMPVMDGIEATAAIRQREQDGGPTWSRLSETRNEPSLGETRPREARRTPILAMTAAAMKGDRERCLQAGMDGYLSKPILADELLAALKRFVLQANLRPAADDGRQAAVRSPAQTGPSRDGRLDLAARESPDEVIDVSAAAERIGGGPLEVAEMAQVLLTECPKLLRQIDDALAAGDAKRLSLAAHTLKSSADVFGAQAVFAAAWRLERLAKAGDLAEAGPVVADLKRETASLATALRAIAYRDTAFAG